MIQFSREFEDQCAEKFLPDAKIGVYASISPEGYPHATLITSITVKTKTSYMWGQFSQGLSKAYLKDNPKTGFLVVSADQYWWTGKSLHKSVAVKGDDFDFFNNKPLFRYNAYCGIGAIHYEDLVDVSAGEKLPGLAFALGFWKSKRMKAAVAKGAPAGEIRVEKIPLFGLKLLSNLMTLKFIVWVDEDGFPRIIPALQGTAADANRVAFSASPYRELLEKIPAGAKASVFLVNLDMEALLLQGRWSGLRQYGGLMGAVLDVDKVYNPMLPLNRYVYPPTELPCVYGA